jgi:hypothetical protein
MFTWWGKATLKFCRLELPFRASSSSDRESPFAFSPEIEVYHFFNLANI